ncbi:acid phosphatase [Candidatus Woesearchaeota archaeon CG10_big_fil_rev_8_21_14_0_10_36_11]|nr:MAG: acid phosphatase [Candidatus Woesearchaeota archaeon CG10_big_fil_rev_8_21_14_0_10_36_11]
MNKILVAIIFAGFGAQLIKLILLWFTHKTLSLHDIIVTDGMPSSHAAFVISLSTIIYLQEGVSTSFAISLVLAFIVLRDSFGVRRSVGKEGKDIEKLFKMHKIKSKFHYAMGHTPLQVLVGAIIGFVVSFCTYYFL